MTDNPGCARPLPMASESDKNSADEVMGEITDTAAVKKRESVNMVMVGRKAPDFTANAYYKGGFTKVSLSDFKDKWVVVCFYPGDFTFV